MSFFIPSPYATSDRSFGGYSHHEETETTMSFSSFGFGGMARPQVRTVTSEYHPRSIDPFMNDLDFDGVEFGTVPSHTKITPTWKESVVVGI